MRPAPPAHVVTFAIEAAMRSPCRSKRGVAIWNQNGQLVSTGYNRQVAPFVCDGSERCKRHCSELAVHAEQDALLEAHCSVAGMEMLHVKAEGGHLMVSGVPSCVACSKLIVAARLKAMWLYHHDGWRRYEAEDFHVRSVAFTPAEF